MRLRAAVLYLLGMALIAYAVTTADAHHGTHRTDTAEFVAGFEGLRLHPYRDAAGVWTVCYGHTGRVEMRTYTHDECLDLLDEDLERFEDGVVALVEPDPTGDRLTALVSLCFNIGLGACDRSRLVALINQGAPEHAIVLEWLSFDHAHVDGRRQVVEGLLERRRREVALFYGEN